MALQLGEIQVKSALNQPLVAAIPLQPKNLTELEGLTVSLAPAEDFARSGLQVTPTDQTLQFHVVTDNNGQALTRNPFHDVRVRRAMSMAVDRAALSERVMEGTARPTGQWLPQGTFGYNPDVPAPAYDPDGARRLLAAAGFPQGFRITLSCPNDRYPNDARTCQAVASRCCPRRV